MQCIKVTSDFDLCLKRSSFQLVIIEIPLEI